MDKIETKELNEYLDEANKNICYVIGAISSIGNDKFNFTIHLSLSKILTEISNVRNNLNNH